MPANCWKWFSHWFFEVTKIGENEKKTNMKMNTHKLLNPGKEISILLLDRKNDTMNWLLVKWSEFLSVSVCVCMWDCARFEDKTFFSIDMLYKIECFRFNDKFGWLNIVWFICEAHRPSKPNVNRGVCVCVCVRAKCLKAKCFFEFNWNKRSCYECWSETMRKQTHTHIFMIDIILC